MKVKVNRLYNGLVSVRDYLIEECSLRDEHLEIECQGKKMTVLPPVSEGWFRTNAKPFICRYPLPNGKTYYYLLDRKWKEDGKIPDRKTTKETPSKNGSPKQSQYTLAFI